MYLYWVKKQRLLDPDLGEYISFGIGVWDLRAGTKPLISVSFPWMTIFPSSAR